MDKPHPAVESQGMNLESIHPSGTSTVQDIDINDTDVEALQKETACISQRAASVIPLEIPKPAPSHHLPTTVPFYDQQLLLSEIPLLPDIPDLRRLLYSGEEASFQREILSGLSTFQAVQHNGLSFDQQARKWLQEFCSGSE
ncbi:hypothetical protein H2204_003869 [Knufia peltigerae]|uniref:Uncharacterized protein n=1 Tax=Knufia peltigerae TaxID=1002370 RepID=A0AA39CZ57_9EURO|nr:hypothetical protein H2204_003869 [Knufia peltigerae]